jgi:hypothetical protein
MSQVQERVVNTEIDERWLPPSPHREKILDKIAQGRAHVEEAGHNQPPLVFFEDGGMMELPRVRWAGGTQFVPDLSESGAARQTHYTDVCGSIDELKRIEEEEPARVGSEAEHITALLDDVQHMMERMHRRWDMYKEAADALMAAAQQMQAITGPDVPGGLAKLEEMRRFLEDRPEEVADNVEWLHKTAEEVRTVAGDNEKTLYAYREAWIEAGAHYLHVKGSRAWNSENGETS